MPPPGSTVSASAWTAVSNQIIGELWAAAGAVGYFTSLEATETKLFQDQQGTIPALDAAFKLPSNTPDRTPTFLKLIKSGLEIMGDVIQFFPIAKDFPRVVRAIALTAHALGAVGEGLGLANKPSPAESYAKITAQVASLQQRERDITEAQRRYVLADYGLLMTVGSLVRGRVLTLDPAAMLSTSRRSFTQWVYELYTPAYWQRYEVTKCRYHVFSGFYCSIPEGATVRKTGEESFVAVLQNDSYCQNYFIVQVCKFYTPALEIGDRIWKPIANDCQYNPAPGSIDAWRYGCNLGVNVNNLIDNRGGWQFHTLICHGRERSACRDATAQDRVASKR
jgi:hypothetical protein